MRGSLVPFGFLSVFAGRILKSVGELWCNLFNYPLSAAKKMLQICETCVSPEYRGRTQQFFNLSTLPERLAGEETLALEYVDVKGNWYTARFIVKKRDAKRKVTHVFYCTRSISEMKRREENWINMVEEASRANAFDEDVIRCLDAGMNVHLTKPLDVKKLIPVLKSYKAV